MSAKKKTYFWKNWFHQQQYKDQLAEAPEDTNAKCKLCKKVFKLSNMAADVLKSHAYSERHKQEIKNLQGIRSYFDKLGMKSSLTTSAKSDSTEETSQPSSSGSSSASGSTMISSIGVKSTTSSSPNKVLPQLTINTYIIFNSVIKAEIIWSLFSVCEGFSNNSVKYFNQTFQSMFSECPTSHKFELVPDKLKYVMN